MKEVCGVSASCGTTPSWAEGTACGVAVWPNCVVALCWVLVGGAVWGGWGCRGMGSRVVVCTKSCALPEVRPSRGAPSPAVHCCPPSPPEYLHCIGPLPGAVWDASHAPFE